MNWQNVATIARKDLTIMMARRSLRIGIAVLPVGLAVLFKFNIKMDIPSAQKLFRDWPDAHRRERIRNRQLHVVPRLQHHARFSRRESRRRRLPELQTVSVRPPDVGHYGRALRGPS